MSTELLLVLKKELYRTLEIKFSEVIEAQFDKAIDAAVHGNARAAYYNYIRLSLLVRELDLLKQSQPQIYQSLARDLIDRKDDRGGFHGARFEIHVAEQFVARAIDFCKQESPDFLIGNISAECTSSRLEGGRTDARRKLSDKIASKSSKVYAQKSCFLMVDVTNLFFHEASEGWQKLYDDLMQDTKKSISTTGFGAIGLFLYYHSQMRPEQSSYANGIVVCRAASPELKAFAHKHYPNNGFSIKGPAVAKEG